MPAFGHVKLPHVESDCVLRTLAVASLTTNGYPGFGGKVNSLGDVETLVKASVISGGSGNNEFSWVVHCLMHGDALFQQIFGMDEGGLVAKEFFALGVVFWVLLGGQFFKVLVAVQVNRVPEFRSAVVEEVDGVQVHVLLVPTKHGFPRANVDIWLIDPLYSALDIHFTEERLEFVKRPVHVGVE